MSRKILSLLLKGRTSELCEVCGTHNGRCDMRGYHFPESTSDGESYDFRGLAITFRRGVPEFKDVKLDRTDFSYAVLDGTMWTRCDFTSCIAEHAQFRKTMFYGSDFTDCHFNECDFRDTVLGGRYRHVNGTMQSTTFSGGRFSGVVFESPVIRDCRFECDVVNVDFNGSRFEGAKFTGKLDKVIFRRKAVDSAIRKKGLSLPIRENRMEHVDFSEASLDDVDFRGGVDLVSCAFPRKSGSFLIFNGPAVFRAVRREIEASWTGEDRRIGLGYTVNCFEDRIEENQNHFLIDGSLLVEDWGESLGHRYASLVRETARRLGSIQILDKPR